MLQMLTSFRDIIGTGRVVLRTYTGQEITTREQPALDPKCMSAGSPNVIG